MAAAAAASLLIGVAGFPAALLLGPLVAGVCFGVGGSAVAVPRPLFVLAQGVAGCLIARSLTPSILGDIARAWPILAVAIAMSLASAAFVGLAVARWGRIPTDAAVWGFLPGMASAMVALAIDQNVDGRLVAVMQYVRLVTVICAMSLIGRLAVDGAPALPVPPIDHLTGSLVAQAAATLAVAGTAFLGRRLAFLPAGTMMVPIAIGATLQGLDLLPITLPRPVLAVAYAIIGFQVGLRFTRATILQVLRLIPTIIAGSVGLCCLCGLSAALLTVTLGIAPVTALLATIPGSIDTVAIVAAGAHADLSFVMAMQAARLILVVVLGPPFARAAVEVMKRRTPAPASSPVKG